MIESALVAAGAPWLAALLMIAPLAIPVKITTSDGETIEAQLTEVTPADLGLQRDGADSRIDVDRVVSLEVAGATEQTPPAWTVTLRHGSRIAAQEVTLTEETMTIEPRRQSPLEVDVSEVASVRFRSGAAETDPQWLGLQDRAAASDLLAIRRDGQRLDPYQGIINGIANGVVDFDMEGTEVKAPVDKLEGVVFGGSREVDDDVPIRIRDVYGSTWNVDAILTAAAVEESGEPGDSSLRISLPGGIEHELPWNQILSIGWSSGMRLLAAVEPASRSFDPYFESNLERGLLNTWFAPRPDQSDLVMQGKSSIEYRVDAGFSTLAGTVTGTSTRRSGDCTLTILIDGQVRWQEKVGQQERLGFELPLAEARRVRFETDCGEDGDLGDAVRITRPRFMK